MVDLINKGGIEVNGKIMIGKIVDGIFYPEANGKKSRTQLSIKGSDGIYKFIQFGEDISNNKDKFIIFQNNSSAYNPTFKNIVLNKIDKKFVRKEEELNKFFEQFNFDVNQLDMILNELNGTLFSDIIEDEFEFILNYIQNIKDEKVKNSVLGFLSDYMDQFKVEKASLKYHHSDNGGLLKHTNEILRLFNELYKTEDMSIKSLLNGIDLNIIIPAIIFHDSGKLISYNGDSITESNKLLEGHIYQSSNLSYYYMRKNKVDSSFMDKIQHCILSHHGIFYDNFDKTYKKIIKPELKEAKLMHYLDLISSGLSD
jgi:23S rRNA maturation-related 3'-5' exoribonuclease YhaM